MQYSGSTVWLCSVERVACLYCSNTCARCSPGSKTCWPQMSDICMPAKRSATLLTKPLSLRRQLTCGTLTLQPKNPVHAVRKKCHSNYASWLHHTLCFCMAKYAPCTVLQTGLMLSQMLTMHTSSCPMTTPSNRSISVTTDIVAPGQSCHATALLTCGWYCLLNPVGAVLGHYSANDWPQPSPTPLG